MGFRRQFKHGTLWLTSTPKQNIFTRSMQHNNELNSLIEIPCIFYESKQNSVIRISILCNVKVEVQRKGTRRYSGRQFPAFWHDRGYNEFISLIYMQCLLCISEHNSVIPISILRGVKVKVQEKVHSAQR